eukprot:GEMP01028220.1.p1 GENE.GEMP01028220.1~~GEMP01028220.1.p1  ORF type:complete len:346 (+),score=98.96 GEMP01028220.1:84-1121(+)
MPGPFPATVNRAAVLGSGAFGTALALVLSRKGTEVMIYARSHDAVEQFNVCHENKKYLPGVQLPHNLRSSSEVREVVDRADLIILAIPTQFLRTFLCGNRAVFPVGTPIVVSAKGIEKDSLQTPYEILQEELPGKYAKHFAVLAGPSFAKEMCAELPTNVAIAAENREVALRVQAAMSSKMFRCYIHSDVMGCEIAGAVKNVLAIAAGACDGLGFGMNSRAALVCRGLREMTRLAKSLGSNGQCMSGLAGVGDLMLTCSSSQSRNYTVGKRVAAGETIENIRKSMVSVAEGVASAESVYFLAQRQKVKMNICDKVYQVLYEGKSLQEALENLLESPPGDEYDENE